MRKKMSACLAVLLSLLMAVSVWADEPGHEQRPDYVTDYYMIVESPDGGIDIYSNAGYDNTKLNNELIPNGTALHIEGEKLGGDNKEWGYTQHHGMYGYVPMDDLKPSTLSEAIDSEYRLADGAAADYEVEVDSTDGSTALYKGPGEKFGEVSGAEEIPNGQKLHISKDAETKDGKNWGYTTGSSSEGWVDLEDTKGWEENITVDVTPAEKQQPEGNAVQPAEEQQPEGSTVQAAEPKPTATPKPTAAPTPTGTPKPTATPTPEPTATPTLKPTATPEPTVAPTNAAAPTPTEEAAEADVLKAAAATPTDKPAATPTSEPTAAPTDEPTATPTKEATPTVAPTNTAAPTEEPTTAVTPTEEAKDTATPAEPSPTEKAQDASSKEVKSSGPWYKSPVVWGAAGGMLIIVLILLYFLKKKKQ